MQRELDADYCRSLGKVITRYLTPSELQAYGEHLEAFAAQVTASRPAQGLHDASYHLRMRFKMPGLAEASEPQDPQWIMGCRCKAPRRS